MWRNCCWSQATQQRNAEDQFNRSHLWVPKLGWMNPSQQALGSPVASVWLDLDCGCVAEVINPLKSVSWEWPWRKHALQGAVAAPAARMEQSALCALNFGSGHGGKKCTSMYSPPGLPQLAETCHSVSFHSTHCIYREETNYFCSCHLPCPAISQSVFGRWETNRTLKFEMLMRAQRKQQGLFTCPSSSFPLLL